MPTPTSFLPPLCRVALRLRHTPCDASKPAYCLLSWSCFHHIDSRPPPRVPRRTFVLATQSLLLNLTPPHTLRTHTNTTVMTVLTLLRDVLLAHTACVWAFFQLPLMLTGIHTALFLPFVLFLYIPIAFAVARSLEALGLFKPGDTSTDAFTSTHLAGKVVLVTGATAGIGLASARRFLELGATVVMHCRSLERGQAAGQRVLQELAESGHGDLSARVVVMKGDLADLEDVAKFAAAFLKKFHGRLDYLILNAGLAGFHRRKTVQGHDLVLGVNFLSHFALARALLPSLEATAREFYNPSDAFQPRVVCLSSTLHQWSRADPSFLLQPEQLAQAQVDEAKEAARKEGGKKQPRTPWTTYLLQAIFKRESYPDSKLAQLFLAMEINTLAKAHHCRVRAIAVNPGAVTSEIWRFLGAEVRAKYVDPVLSKIFISCPQAAMPVVRAAVGEPLGDPIGMPNAYYLTPYFVPCKGYVGGLCLFDLFSPFYGCQRAVPRLPFGAAEKATGLWHTGNRIVHSFLLRHGLLTAALTWPPVCEGGEEEGEEGGWEKVGREPSMATTASLSFSSAGSSSSSVSTNASSSSPSLSPEKGKAGKGEGDLLVLPPQTPATRSGLFQRKQTKPPLAPKSLR